MSVSKALTSALVALPLEKYIEKQSWMYAAKCASVLGVSVYAVPMITNAIPAISSMLSFLGSYSDDVVSALIAALITTMFLKNMTEGESKSYIPSGKALLLEFLIFFGSIEVAGLFVEPILGPYIVNAPGIGQGSDSVSVGPDVALDQ